MRTTQARKFDNMVLTRLAYFDETKVDAQARTVEVAFSSEYAEGVRVFGIEILGHSPGEVDLTRLNAGAALLLNHSHDKQIGVIESARIDADRVGRAVVRFGNSPLAREIFQDVSDGIRKHISVGYRVIEAEYQGERDGVDVIRVTRWMPLEVSIVPVPFDPSVGVGRSMSSIDDKKFCRSSLGFQTHQPNIAKKMPNQLLIDQLERAFSRPSQNSPSFGLQRMFDDARRAAAFDSHYPAGCDEPSYVRPAFPGSMCTVRMSDSFPRLSTDLARALDSAGQSRAPGVVHTIGSEVAEASRVLQAGAVLVPIADAPQPMVNTSNIVAWTSRPTRMETITAPAFSIVSDEADVTVSELPVSGADIELGDAPSHAIAFTLTRAEQKQRSDADMEFIIARSLALGVARLVDSVALRAIMTANPTAFNFGKAAARGHRVHELSAICGTLGTGGAMGGDGVFRVAGVPAELSEVISQSLVGNFGRIGVALEDEIRVIAKRTSTQGDLEITCFLSVAALMPTGVSDMWVAA